MVNIGSLMNKIKTYRQGDVMMMPVSAVPHSLRFKEYMLRVPPTVKTAKEGVAWTFDLPAEDYEPVFQS